ncbi:hypothetical protein V6N12_034907 [Hibiscus sabdariffa]|uniref:Uncharacterized protein n=1 Tax=Hibiscus sabdariffa TaxID=183260 RepID=A0ABR2BNU2_9ROSI
MKGRGWVSVLEKKDEEGKVGLGGGFRRGMKTNCENVGIRETEGYEFANMRPPLPRAKLTCVGPSPMREPNWLLPNMPN